MQLLKINSDVDLFKAKPIALQIKEHGELAVLTQIRIWVEKCIMGLNLKNDSVQVELLCSDIMDVYSYDSIEDVQAALKSARQGKYGFGFNNRTAITMELFSEWMSKHLESKSLIREKIIQNRKANEEPITNEEALKWLSEWKKSIAKIETKSKPNKIVDLEVLLNSADQKTQKAFISCMDKIDNEIDLTEAEIEFLKGWNIKI